MRTAEEIRSKIISIIHKFLENERHVYNVIYFKPSQVVSVLSVLVKWIDCDEIEEDALVTPYRYDKKRFQSESDMVRYMNDIDLDSDAVVDITYKKAMQHEYPWVLIYAYRTKDDMLATQEVERNTHWEEYFDILNRKYGG